MAHQSPLKPTTFTLRNATEHDNKLVMNIVNQAYSLESGEASGVAFKVGDRWTNADEPAVFIQDGRCIVACDKNDSIIGVICYDLNYHGDTSQGEFGPLAVL